MSLWLHTFIFRPQIRNQELFRNRERLISIIVFWMEELNIFFHYIRVIVGTDDDYYCDTLARITANTSIISLLRPKPNTECRSPLNHLNFSLWHSWHCDWHLADACRGIDSRR